MCSFKLIIPKINLEDIPTVTTRPAIGFPSYAHTVQAFLSEFLDLVTL